MTPRKKAPTTTKKLKIFGPKDFVDGKRYLIHSLGQTSQAFNIVKVLFLNAPFYFRQRTHEKAGLPCACMLRQLVIPNENFIG